MSKLMQQMATRPAEEMIQLAFEIALAQVGVSMEMLETFLYFTISGNKDAGMIEVATPRHRANVFLVGNSETLFYVDRVEFTEIAGRVLEIPNVVKIHNFDGLNKGHHRDEAVVLENHIRIAVVTQLVGKVFGAEMALSVIKKLSKYPLISMDKGSYLFTYTFRPTESFNYSLVQLDLSYNPSSLGGYTYAVITSPNRVRQFACNPADFTWVEHTVALSKP